MRFHQLSIGQTFRFQDEIYTKQDSLMSVHAGSGRRRLIKRSAEVEPCRDETETAAAAPTRDALPTATVLAAFDAFHEQCRALLADAADPTRQDELNARLEQARQAFLTRLET